MSQSDVSIGKKGIMNIRKQKDTLMSKGFRKRQQADEGPHIGYTKKILCLNKWTKDRMKQILGNYRRVIKSFFRFEESKRMYCEFSDEPEDQKREL